MVIEFITLLSLVLKEKPRVKFGNGGTKLGSANPNISVRIHFAPIRNDRKHDAVERF